MRSRAPIPESDVVASCLQLLKLRGWPAWRNNTGAARMGDRFIRYGIPGAADILGIVPGSGRLLAIECKRPKLKAMQSAGRLSPAQESFLSSVHEAGGVALVIDDPGELAEILAVLARKPDAVFSPFV